VEAACYSHPLASEVSVFGVSDERLGEVPAAVVYAENGGLSGDALLSFLGEKIAQFKLPAHVWIHDEPLPKLGTGKIDKVTLRDRYRRELESRG
jgi:acyl-CoA synthetase (AMP-forming)/AMP-acid ligase II